MNRYSTELEVHEGYIIIVLIKKDPNWWTREVTIVKLFEDLFPGHMSQPKCEVFDSAKVLFIVIAKVIYSTKNTDKDTLGQIIIIIQALKLDS